MGIYKNLTLVYGILPYLNNVENKWSLIISMVLGSRNWKVKMNNISLNFSSDAYEKLVYFLGLIEFAFSYRISNEIITLSLDGQNEFRINLINQSYEEENLIELLFKASKKGANFITNESGNTLREKEIRIYEKNGKKFVETSNEIKFFMDSIHPSNTIVETFIEKIHLVNSKENLEGKIILDIGAECGDTALFFASLGAQVFSFEPIKDNFNALKKNLELNPNLSKRITAVNAGVGQDGDLKFFKDPKIPNYGASFVHNKRGEKAIIETVEGISLDTVLKKYDIEQVELMKMDCKGCEFYLTESALSKINRVKIEFSGFHKTKSIQDVLDKLKKTGFKYVVYRNSETRSQSNSRIGNIYGEK
tara:strand:- start:2141 stop:3229 length:1089 start_codon:yes stop_codon:yes gene_type:complete